MALWSIFATSSPGENKWISENERTYLNECLKNPQRKVAFYEKLKRNSFRFFSLHAQHQIPGLMTRSLRFILFQLSRGPIPWKSIARSMPVMANLLTMFAISFTVTTMQSFLPTYFRDVLLIDIKKVICYILVIHCKSVHFFLSLRQVHCVWKNLLSQLTSKMSNQGEARLWKLLLDTVLIIHRN